MDDDGANYGAEEAEMQAALEKELADEEAKAENPEADKAMAGTDDKEDDDAASDNGSEDLEAESSDSDDDEDEDEGGEAEGDEDIEMGDGEEKPAQAGETAGGGSNAPPSAKQAVMAH